RLGRHGLLEARRRESARHVDTGGFFCTEPGLPGDAVAPLPPGIVPGPPGVPGFAPRPPLVPPPPPKATTLPVPGVPRSAMPLVTITSLPFGVRKYTVEVPPGPP